MSRRQGDALKAKHALLPAVHASSRIAEIMPCGGTSTASLLKRLPATTSLSVTEMSQHNISFISERLVQEGYALERVTYMLMRSGILPYDTASLDLVILPQVIEQMPDPQAMLNEARRVLAPGGHLLISTRNIDSSYGEICGLWSHAVRYQIKGRSRPVPPTRYQPGCLHGSISRRRSA